MTMLELSRSYELSATLLQNRLRYLRKALEASRDPEEIWHLKRRIKDVIREELTELQRYTLVAYYFEDRSILQIAEERSVNKSTVLRTLRRAETKLQRYLKY